MTNGGSGGRQENKRWSLIHGPRFLAVLLVISMIHVAASQNQMGTRDRGFNKNRSPRYVKTTGQTSTQSSRVCNTTECIKAAKLIKSSMNLNVHPCDDFYEYACGSWSFINPLPSGYSYLSLFDVAHLKMNEYKKLKLENSTKEVSGISKTIQKMPSDLYKSCMNLKAIDNLGAAPLRERIRELGGWDMSGDWDEDTWDFNKTLLSIHKIIKDGPLFLTGGIPDENNKTKKALAILQAGPALKKEEYLNLSSKAMSAYRELIIDVVDLLGGNVNTTAKKVDELISFEAQLADVSLTSGEIDKFLNNNITLIELQREVPEFDWINYFNVLYASPSSSTINESELIYGPALSYLKKAMKIVQKTPKRVLANYMVWFVIRTEVNWLSASFRKAQLEYNQATTGTTSDEELSKKCVGQTEKSFGDVIAVAYIKEHYAQLTSKTRMTKRIFSGAIQAFKDNVNSLTWLDNGTRSEVLQKIDAVKAKIGFPAYMMDSKKLSKIFEKYRGLKITRGTYFKNKVSILKQERQQMLKKFMKPIDLTIWRASPLNNNAQYDILTNTLTLPAVILQPPFFFPNKFLRAYNLGNLGSVVAHEIMHGFSPAGRPYDQEGKTRNWWSRKSLKGFNKRVKCYEEQYSAYKILGKWPIRVKDTADETVTDNGALKIALKDYYNWVKQNPSEAWLLPGLNFTNEQLFYIGFAQNRCSSSTLTRREQMSLSGSHPDDKFRVIGPLANSCEFANTFKCKKNSPMNPLNKCYLWSKEGTLN
ncbi:endothelin-converting enzyme 1-like [Actinia tenebrosa]|uniref:Endothelin-converting enzyme 1-like n=1 Tax=Actinia tenebrosa TaxID=6105 RepID=A0A6P8HNN8_ACTTE|nr:endothelin-converting enzyme 1-like [Actinia tenebrosa]